MKHIKVMNSSKDIYKVQVPIVTTDPNPMALIYNKDRSSEGQVPVTKELLAIMDGEYKQFFYAVYKDGELTLLYLAPWQEW